MIDLIKQTNKKLSVSDGGGGGFGVVPVFNSDGKNTLQGQCRPFELQNNMVFVHFCTR